MSPKIRQVALGQVKPYVVERQRLQVANDVFNSMSMFGLVACHPALDQQCGDVLLYHRAL
jgi:hypothetical protein